MFDEITIQDWLTLSGPDTGDEVVQDCDEWSDMAGFDAARLYAYVKKATNISLAVETATSAEGPWSSLYAITSASDDGQEVECDPDAQYMVARYLRWKLTSTGASWKACFCQGAVFSKDEEAQQYSGPSQRVLTRTPARPQRGTATASKPAVSVGKVHPEGR